MPAEMLPVQSILLQELTNDINFIVHHDDFIYEGLSIIERTQFTQYFTLRRDLILNNHSDVVELFIQGNFIDPITLKFFNDIIEQRSLSDLCEPNSTANLWQLREQLFNNSQNNLYRTLPLSPDNPSNPYNFSFSGFRFCNSHEPNNEHDIQRLINGTHDLSFENVKSNKLINDNETQLQDTQVSLNETSS